MATFEDVYPQNLPYSWPEGLPKSDNSQALANSIIAASGQCRLLGFTVSSTRASGQFIQLFDQNTVPGNGAIPIISMDILTAAAKGVSWGSSGRWMNNGVVVCNSTTQGSLTIGAADTLFDVQYVPQVI